MTAIVDDELVSCQFCGEDGFDLIGLKRHLLRGWCEVFERVDNEVAPEIFEGTLEALDNLGITKAQS